MKKDLQIFKNKELGLQVRAIKNDDGSISIDAEDTAIGFGWYQEKNNKKYPKWERMNGFIAEFGVSPQVGKDDYIPESLFYMLGMKASNKVAQDFQKWLAIEIIPSIRKHGAYMTDNAIEKALTSPDFIIQLATQLKEERQKRVEAERFQNLLATSNNSVLVREVAKMCCKNGIIIGEKRLWQKLREWKMIFQNSTEPMQRWIESGHFEVMTRIIERSNGAQSVRTARVTGKGQQYIITKLLKEQSMSECASTSEG